MSRRLLCDICKQPAPRGKANLLLRFDAKGRTTRIRAHHGECFQKALKSAPGLIG